MSKDLVVKHFEGKPVAFRSEGGNLTLTPKEIGELLGYKNPAEAIGHIFSNHKDEFDNDCTHLVGMTTLDEFDNDCTEIILSAE